MKNTPLRRPSILYPYTAPCSTESCYDIFVYLRPETNGVETESALLRVINNTPQYKKEINLAYLANIPGDFIVENKIIEHHYASKILFARQGKEAMTPSMCGEFQNRFGVTPEKAVIWGAFEALSRLNLSWRELFEIWVPEEDILKTCGQVIKRIGDNFIINCDIPALLHKNNSSTDIAVMLFRTPLEYRSFEAIVSDMKGELETQGIIKEGIPLSRIFHHSRGPFEQVLDADSYLFNDQGKPISITRTSFSRYLVNKGFSPKQLRNLMKNPICLFETKENLVEADIFTYTIGDSYSEALRKFISIRAQMTTQTRTNRFSQIPTVPLNSFRNSL